MSFVKETIFRKSWLEEFESLKNQIKERFGEESFRNLSEIVSKLATYHYHRNKYLLLGKEKQIYDFLIESGHNPYKIYRWYLLERIPEQLRFQLKNGMINQKQASQIHFKRKHESESQVCLQIKMLGLSLVRSM